MRRGEGDAHGTAAAVGARYARNGPPVGTIGAVRRRALEAFDQVVRRMGLRYTPMTELPPPPPATGPAPPLVWHAQPMAPRVDLRDRDAVMAAMDGA